MRKAFVWLAVIAAFFSAYGADVNAQQAPVAVPPYRYGSQPVVLIPNIDNVLLNELPLVHYWNFGDSPCGGAVGCTPGPCATQLADMVASDTVAVVTPSPVPLTCSSPTASPWPYLGATGLVQDGTTMAELTNGIANGSGTLEGQWFTPASVGLLSSLCNNNAGGSCNQAFTVGCVVEGGNLVGPNYFFSADGTGNLALGASPSTGLSFLDRGIQLGGFSVFASGHPYVIEYTFDGTSKSSVYLDGVLAFATTSPVPQVSPNSVTYFGSETGSVNSWNGRIGKCWLFNTAAPASDARLVYSATGFW